MVAYKFVKWDVPKLNTLVGTQPYRLKIKVLNKERLTREEKNALFNRLATCSYSKVGIALGGWMFNFSEVLKTYYVKFTYGHIQEYYAPDKTSIRMNLSNIRRIVEVNN